MRTSVLSFVAAALLVGCSASQTTSGKIDREALMESRWTLAEMHGKPVKVAINGAVPWLEFDENLQLRGNGGCNSFSASTITPSDAALVVGELTHTERACAALGLEQEYFTNLQGSFTVQVADNKLSLLQAEGTAALVFIAEPKL